MGTDDEETVNQTSTREQQQNDPLTTLTPNSNTKRGRRNNYRHKNEKSLVNSVASSFFEKNQS